MNYAGYCLPAGRILTDDEKIRAAIGYLLKKYPPAAIRTPLSEKVWANSPPEHPIFYKDVDDFLAINPDCCQLTAQRDSTEGHPGLTQRVTGTTIGYIKIEYQVRYQENGIVKSVLYDEYPPISNCGKPVKAINIFNPLHLFLGFNPANLFN